MKTVRDYDFSGKRVLLRADLDCALKDGKVVDDFRLRKCLPTINHILSKCRQLVIITKVARPDGKVVKWYSVKSIAERLEELTGKKVTFLDDCIQEKLPDDKLIVLENLRFHKEEEENDQEFAKKLATYGEIYVNETFACAHRKEASIVSVPKYLPGCIGLQFEKELKYLNIKNAEQPVVAIIGGAKLGTKIPVMENLLNNVDNILLGGAMIFNFYKVQGLEIGKSLYREEHMKEAEKYLKNPKVVLPVDIVVADEASDEAEAELFPADKIPKDKMGLDIGPESVEKYKKILSKAKTIIWNGPVGYYEIDKFSKATNEIIDFMVGLGVITIIGGGDTSAAVNKMGIADKFTHISTGGGASLNVLAGEQLVALEALRE